jgi:hypothetical protein
MGMTRNLKPNQQIMKPDGRLLEACEDLRRAVEHPNERSEIIMQQGIYKQKDPEAIMTVKVDGVEVGYKIKESSPLEMNPYFKRYVYVKVPGHRIGDLTKAEVRAIMTAIMETFFEPQQGPIEEIKGLSSDSLGWWQQFAVAFPVQRNPNVLSLVGGFQA